MNFFSSELSQRIITGAALALLGLGSLWVGGWFLLLVCAIVSGVMAWELLSMTTADNAPAAIAIGILGLLAVWSGGQGYMILGLVCILASIGIGWLLTASQWRAILPIYLIAVILAGLGLFVIREEFGFATTLWVILVVISSDIAGYFGGKALGGAKFAPTISPNKTWSGTICGWAAAALVGLIFAPFLGLSLLEAMLVSVCAALLAQVGDLCESAIKRISNTKDSSAILPGHGGVLDRFDGLIFVAVAMLVMRGIVAG